MRHLFLVLLAWPLMGWAQAPIQLADVCPAGFETTAENTCKLHTRYDQYDSLYERGVGGLQTALPAHREGFSPQQIDLGRHLFFDPLLSGDQAQSCASCHHPKLGFADGLKRSIGANGAENQRAAPSLWNMAFLTRFFWDARSGSLEEQMTGPLFSPVEMAASPELLLERLNASAEYRRLFAEAYPKQDVVTLDQLYLSLAAFQTSLISLNSPYDRYAHGSPDALNARELEGFNVYRSFVARCSECHTPPLFTNQQIAVIGVPEPDGRPFDPGAQVPLRQPGLARRLQGAVAAQRGADRALHAFGQLCHAARRRRVLHQGPWSRAARGREGPGPAALAYLGAQARRARARPPGGLHARADRRILHPGHSGAGPSGLAPVGRVPPALQARIASTTPTDNKNEPTGE